MSYSTIIGLVVFIAFVYIIYRAGKKQEQAKRDIQDADEKKAIADKIIDYAGKQAEIDKDAEDTKDWAAKLTPDERAAYLEQLLSGGSWMAGREDSTSSETQEGTS